MKKSGKDIKCIVCGKEFYVSKFCIKTRKYCSRDCMYSKGSPRNKGISQTRLNFDSKEWDNIKQKLKDTFLSKYGVEHNSQIEAVKESKKLNAIKKYGVDNPLKSPTVRKKQQSTLLERYGVDNISKLDSIKRKKINTMLSHYGVKYPYHNDQIYKKMRKALGGKTKPEQIVENFLKSANIQYVYDYPIDDGNSIKRYDFYLPTFNLLIEFDGEYWHSLDSAKKNDIAKNEIAKRKGYKLVRIKGRGNLDLKWEIIVW